MRVSFIPYVQGRNAYPDADGRKYGIAIHATASTASAEDEAAYARRRTDGISSHIYADVDTAIQSVDTKDRCGHAGSKIGNENAVCIEITGLNSWTREQWLQRVNWPLLARVLAAIIQGHWPDGSFGVRRASVDEMKENPKVKAFYGHDDMRRAWGGTTHTDPGPNFPWDHLIRVVDAALGGDMAYDTANEVHNLYMAYFYGGTSCGEPVADEYRTRKVVNGVPTDEFANEHGNSWVEQQRAIRGEQEKILAAIAAVPAGPAGPPGPTPKQVQFGPVVADVIAVETP